MSSKEKERVRIRARCRTTCHVTSMTALKLSLSLLPVVQIEAMQAVSFMYTKPPGYNAESARAAEIADEHKALQGSEKSLRYGLPPSRHPHPHAPSQPVLHFLRWLLGRLEAPESAVEDVPAEEALLAEVEAGGKRKRRAKDVFGRTIATAEEFPQLVNAPK